MAHYNNRCSSSTSCVLWSGQCSSSFAIKQGVRQEGILSPILHCLFMDEHLKQVSSLGVGVYISAGNPLMLLIAASPSALQFMLDLVDQCA